MSDLGHQSPLEHITFTFGIEGVSRSLTHQLVRHRIASYSQQSQRYVNISKPQYVTPSDITEDEDIKYIYDNTMEIIWKSYIELTDKLKAKYLKQGYDSNSAEKKAIENARYVLPNACETKIIVTMNARSLLNFFEERCCNRAQDEIRDLAKEMLRLVKNICPTIFNKAGASCVRGQCKEGAMSCKNLNKKIQIKGQTRLD